MLTLYFSAVSNIYVFIEFGGTAHVSMDPENATICKGKNATFNCGYFLTNFPVITPQWIINETKRFTRMEIVNDTNDLLQWIIDGNDTNTTRLLVCPVDERFVGRTTFQ